MKKSLKLRLTAFIAALVLCISWNSALAAAPGEDVVSPNYTAISSMSNDLTLIFGDLECYGQMQTISGYTAEITVQLQVMDDRWRTTATWTDDRDAAVAWVNEDYTPPRSSEDKKYRLYITNKAYDKSGKLVETVYTTSNTVTVPGN